MAARYRRPRRNHRALTRQEQEQYLAFLKAGFQRDHALRFLHIDPDTFRTWCRGYRFVDRVLREVGPKGLLP